MSNYFKKLMQEDSLLAIESESLSQLIDTKIMLRTQAYNTASVDIENLEARLERVELRRAEIYDILNPEPSILDEDGEVD